MPNQGIAHQKGRSKFVVVTPPNGEKPIGVPTGDIVFREKKGSSSSESEQKPTKKE